jgi:hypothetical protein
MKTHVTLEQVVFFAVAKAVRNEQEYRINAQKTKNEILISEKEKRTSLYIHVSDFSVYSIAYNMTKEMKSPISRKQFWAVFYKLQDMEMVKIHKGNSRRVTKLGLGNKGVMYVQSLKAAN